MALYFLRGAFVLLAACVTMLYVLQEMYAGRPFNFPYVVLILGIILGISSFLIAVDVFMKPKRLASLSGVFVGLVAGLLLAYAMGFVVDLVGVLAMPAYPSTFKEIQLATTISNLLQGLKVFIGLVTCYVCISLVLQTKDDFRFIVPYVEFTRQIRGTRSILLDTSVIIDGRISEIIDTQLVQGSLIVPRFVLNELQALADSADKLRRLRGRRGLDVLQKLQDSHIVEVTIDDYQPEGASVDQNLVAMALEYEARIMTNDYNLNKIATIRGVDVINLNDLAKALRPVVLPGEQMRVKIIRPGESAGQGVGYLEDGTMVVVENGRQALNEEVDAVVTSTLQTSAGRMIFGRYDRPGDQMGADPTPPPPTRTTDARIHNGGTVGRNPRRVR